MTLMEVKGHQRSNGVNYVLWLPYLVKRRADADENDDDLYGGQRSSEVKWVKLCDMATIFWSKELVMQAKNDDDLDGGQRSSEVKYGNIMCHSYHIWSKELLMQV